MNARVYFWAPALLMVALGIVGSMDFEEANLKLHHYCEMVESNHWPDYEGTYGKECRPLGYKDLRKGRHIEL